MDSGVTDRRIAFLAAAGVEQGDLTEPWTALERAGARPHLVSVHSGTVQATRRGEPGEWFPVDRTLSQARAGEYDALVIPGGAASVDALRASAAVAGFLRAFMDADKPVAAVADGVRLLVEADVLRGRSVAGPPGLGTAIRGAGGEWIDRPVHIDQRLVTGTGADTLPQFRDRLVSVLAGAIDERRLDFMVEQTFPASDPLPGPRPAGGSRAGSRTVPPPETERRA